MYIITTLDGSNYLCQRQGTTKYTLCSDKAQAMQFTSKKDAENYIHNCLPKSLRRQYRAVKDDDKPVSIIQEECKMQKDDTLTLIKQFSKLSRNSKTHLSKITKQLDAVEAKLVDVYHYIQLHDLDVVRGYKIYKQLQELLKERRVLKDEKKLTEAFIRDLESSNTLFDSFFTAESLLHTRTYSPRALPELFENDD